MIQSLAAPFRNSTTPEVQPDVRRSTAQLVRQRRLSLPNRRTFLYFNNRLEGNAPRTIAAVLAMAAEGGRHPWRIRAVNAACGFTGPGNS